MLEDFLLRRLALVRRVAFLGLAKNTGKTTALGFVAGLLHENGERLGLLTSGRDGEACDRITRDGIHDVGGDITRGEDRQVGTLLRAVDVTHQVAVFLPLAAAAGHMHRLAGIAAFQVHQLKLVANELPAEAGRWFQDDWCHWLASALT